MGFGRRDQLGVVELKYLFKNKRQHIPQLWKHWFVHLFVFHTWETLFLGSITSRCSGKWARTHRPERAAGRATSSPAFSPTRPSDIGDAQIISFPIASQTRSTGHESSRLSSGRIKDRTRETTEIEPTLFWKDSYCGYRSVETAVIYPLSM